MPRPLPERRPGSPWIPPSALAAILCLPLALPVPAAAAAPKPAARAAAPGGAEEHMLANGMRVLLVPRHLSPTVSCGWVARVGSANEAPGITGMAHLFEHMMFKGTHVLGTRDYELDARLIVLTHMADDMLARIASIPERCASDGMVITL